MKKFNSMTFATNLNVFRTKAHLTKKAVAETLGVSVDTITNYERGITVPDFRACWILADLYHVSMDELGGRDGYDYAA